MTATRSIRLRNPLSPGLTGSTVLFRSALSVGGHGTVRDMTIPHELIDAFGGLLLLAKLSDGLAATWTPDIPQSASGVVAGCEWHHVWLETKDIADNGVSFAQQGLAALLATFGPDSLSALSVAVAVDDVDQVPELGPWGNSFALVNLSRAEADTLTRAPRALWRSSLRTRAERSLALIERRPSLRDKTNKAEALFSSLGRLDRFAKWLPPGLDPRSLVMVPTPSARSMATVVFWSRGPYQAMVIAGAATHPVVLKRGELTKAWRRIFL